MPAAATPDPAEGGDQAGPDYSSGIMVALMLPASVAASLALPGGLPAAELHVTLAYLGDVQDVDDAARFLPDLLAAVGEVAEEYGPVEGTVGGVGRFCGDGGDDPFYASLDAPRLDELRTDLVRELRDAGIEPSSTHGFTPHIALSYVPAGDPPPLPRLPAPVPVVVDALTVMFGAARVDVPLTAEPPRDHSHDPHPYGDNPGRPGRGGGGALTVEEIADPRSWGELYTLRTFRGGVKSSFWDESAHPRAAGGKFGPKDQTADGSQLPPDWLNQLLAGNPKYVKTSGRKKGKGKGKGKAQAAARARVAAARRARIAAARASRNTADLAEMNRRNLFDSATAAENQAENLRRWNNNVAILSETDPGKKNVLRAAEQTRRARWTAAQMWRHSQERARRRAYEIQRKAAAAAGAAPPAAAAGAKGLGVAAVADVGDVVGVDDRGATGTVEQVIAGGSVYDPLTECTVVAAPEDPVLLVAVDGGPRLAMLTSETRPAAVPAAAPGVGQAVTWAGGAGTVDMVVTGGQVPGVGGAAVGTKGAPLARVRTPAGRVAVPVHALTADADGLAGPPASAVEAVRGRGMRAWPGPGATSLSRQEWAQARVGAFLAAAAGDAPAVYCRDDDLLGP